MPQLLLALSPHQLSLHSISQVENTVNALWTHQHCRVLDCTVVTALFAMNASFVYLLSWVILHQQFVGIRVTHSAWNIAYKLDNLLPKIVAVILCTTGISLFAYMDRVNHQQTLISVILASASGKIINIFSVIILHFDFSCWECHLQSNVQEGDGWGELPPSISLLLGYWCPQFDPSVANCDDALLYWSRCGLNEKYSLSFTYLYFTPELVTWSCLPWPELCGAASLSLGKIIKNITSLFSILSSVANLLANFSIIITYENFISCGLIAAVPASAGW